MFAAAKVVWLHTGAKPKYPVCFLTNGGGVTEAQKAEQLSGWLDVAVGVDQVAQHAGQPLYCPTAPSVAIAACANLVRAVASFALQQWQVLQANIPMTSFNSTCFFDLFQVTQDEMLVKHLSMFLSLQVVLSHTPYRELAKDLGDKPVVISGRGASEVAAAYGFKRAVTTSQLSARYPKAVPFCHDPGVAPTPSCLSPLMRSAEHTVLMIYMLVVGELQSINLCL